MEIDPEVHTLVWPNGAGFDPATLHDWPEYIGDHVALSGSGIDLGQSAYNKAMPRAPFISIILVTWNSKAHLPRCLSALSKQTLQDFEIVLVDNGSDDDALDALHEKYPSLDLHIHRLSSNLGFAVANNIGARLARGKWLALLNADAFPEPDWLERLAEAAEVHPHAFFASRQIQEQAPELLDGAGDSYHISGLGWRRYHHKPAVNYGLQQEEVFSPCAAAAFYLRDDFLQAGGFDEDYFSYFEDVDLGFRLRLSGKKCLYIPEAVVLHVGSASTGKRSDFSVYYGYRNLIWTFIKNMPAPLVWLFLPLHVATLLFSALYLSLRGQGPAIFKAIFDAIRGLPIVLRKRKDIQKNIKIRPRDLLTVMSTGAFAPCQEFIKRLSNAHLNREARKVR